MQISVSYLLSEWLLSERNLDLFDKFSFRNLAQIKGNDLQVLSSGNCERKFLRGFNYSQNFYLCTDATADAIVLQSSGFSFCDCNRGSDGLAGMTVLHNC